MTQRVSRACSDNDDLNGVARHINLIKLALITILGFSSAVLAGCHDKDLITSPYTSNDKSKPC